MSLLSPRSRPLLLAITAVLVFLLALYELPSYSPYIPRVTSYFPNHRTGATQNKPRQIGLHLLLPATAANKHLCRLIFSAIVTRYPDPVLVGWEGHGHWNGTESHLFKVSETLAYLQGLPPEQDDDLILLLDAYDSWLQLPPDILIKRYHSALARQNSRLKQEGIYGKRQYGVDSDSEQFITKTTMLWGPDKKCWPKNDGRAACWAAPGSSEWNNATLGPGGRIDDQVIDPPQWLNSGTLIGPVKDVRDLFAVTMDTISREYEPGYFFHNSDQMYIADVWGEQEVGRLRLKNGTDIIYGPDSDSKVPAFESGRRTEYHVGVDELTEVFQTGAYFYEFMTWMRFNHSSTSSRRPLPTPSSQTYLSPSLPGRLDRLALDATIISSPGPFSALAHTHSTLSTNITLPHASTGWESVMLGINTMAPQPFPLLHLTDGKLRSIPDRWWPRMWFHEPGGEMLLQATIRARKNILPEEEEEQKGVFAVGGAANGAVGGSGALQKDPAAAKGAAPREMVIAVVDGVDYVARDTRRGTAKDQLLKRGSDKGGAWSDQGIYFTWDTLCAKSEEEVFVKAKIY